MLVFEQLLSSKSTEDKKLLNKSFGKGSAVEIFLFPIKNFFYFSFGKKSIWIFFPFSQYKEEVKTAGPLNPL